MATLDDTVILRGGDGRLGVVTSREFDLFTRLWYFHVEWAAGVTGVHHMTDLIPLLPVLGVGSGCILREGKTS